jgi:hypothetical protein
MKGDYAKRIALAKQRTRKGTRAMNVVPYGCAMAGRCGANLNR